MTTRRAFLSSLIALSIPIKVEGKTAWQTIGIPYTNPRRAERIDLFISPDALEDMRNWGTDINPQTHEEILCGDGKITRLFSVNLTTF
jgi:hypothetical protein